MTNFNKDNNNNIYPIHNEHKDIKLSNKQLTKISNDIINIVFKSEDDYEAEYSIIEKIKEIILLNDTAKHIESLRTEYTLSPEEKEQLKKKTNTQKP